MRRGGGASGRRGALRCGGGGGDGGDRGGAGGGTSRSRLPALAAGGVIQIKAREVGAFQSCRVRTARGPVGTGVARLSAGVVMSFRASTA